MATQDEGPIPLAGNGDMGCDDSSETMMAEMGTRQHHLFFAHHIFDLAQYAQSQWKPAVEPGGEFANETGSQHQLVADDLGVCGSFFLGRN